MQYFLAVLWWLSSAARRWQRCWLPSLVFCLALANHGGQAGDPFFDVGLRFLKFTPENCTIFAAASYQFYFCFSIFFPRFWFVFCFPVYIVGWLALPSALCLAFVFIDSQVVSSFIFLSVAKTLDSFSFARFPLNSHLPQYQWLTRLSSQFALTYT